MSQTKRIHEHREINKNTLQQQIQIIEDRITTLEEQVSSLVRNLVL
jgi:hypothetical protein